MKYTQKKSIKKYLIAAFCFATLFALCLTGTVFYNESAVNAEAATISTVGGATTFSYTGGVQTFTATYAGYYQIQLYGASGGDYSKAGGNGAYTTGVILLGAGETLYVYVGQSGDNQTAATYNGGGYSEGYYNARAGGGATDVRLVSGTWSDFSSLKSRIMVAAGGGGSDGYGSGSAGGYGGALTGGNGTHSGDNTYYDAVGATQTSGGSGAGSDAGGYGEVGQFGIGGRCNGANHGAGGGGGYFGGSGGGHNSGVVGSGSGGSSFISGYTGCNAINYSSTSNSTISFTNESTHYSGKTFASASMTANANDGNGRAVITYTRAVGSVLQVQTGITSTSVESGTATNLTNMFARSAYSTSATTTYTVNDTTVSSPTSYTFSSAGTYTVKCSLTYGGKTSSRSVTVYVGATTNFSYTGGAQSFTAPVSGYYYFEAWGAQGGNCAYNNLGGYGGYSAGKIYLTAGTVIYVYVGQGGYLSGDGNVRFNGGGAAPTYGGGWTGWCAGGGATDFRLTNGTWSDLGSLKSRILVAGGGGGGNNGDGGATNNICGGSGGGLTGGTNKSSNATGGTQTGGNAFGIGQNNNSRCIGADAGAGGGGYYGGYSAPDTNSGGGGGSSFISGYSGCNAIDLCSFSGYINHSGQSIHYSGYYFVDGVMTQGSWGSTAGNSSANGKASIKCLSSDSNADSSTSSTFSYTGAAQSYSVTTSGYYRLECWGAQGGTCSSNNLGGKGGYTSGTVYLSAGTVIYIYVGQYGYNTGNSNTTFNGGGAGVTFNGGYTGMTAGGGATDFRLSGGSWNDTTGLRSRIMVAGGGGGGGDGNAYAPYGTDLDKIAGGCGGNLSGGKAYSGNNSYPNTSNSGTYVNGGSQTSGYAFGYGGANNSNSGYADTGAGGGGYFGGYAGCTTNCGGGGGSSFISGYAGCKAVNASGTITTTSVHYSGYIFSNAKMTAGINSGAGQAKITLLQSDSTSTSTYTSAVSVSGTTKYYAMANSNELYIETTPTLVANRQQIYFPSKLTSGSYTSYDSAAYAAYEIGGGTYQFILTPSINNLNSCGKYTVLIYRKIGGYGSTATLYTDIYCDNTAPSAATITPARNLTYYYNSVSVSFSATDAGCGMSHYTFSTDGSNYATGSSTTLSSSASSGISTITLYVRAYDLNGNYSQTSRAFTFDRNTYSIGYVLRDNGVNSSSNPSSYNVESVITFQNPSRSGFNFNGWYTSSAYSTAVTTIPSQSQGNRTIYAKWTIIPIATPSVSFTNKTYDGNFSNITCSASHALTITYQWYRSGTAISGATSNTYAIKNVADSGSYSCNVTVTSDGQTTTATSAAVAATISQKAITATVSAYKDNYRSYASPTTAGQAPEAGTGTAASPYIYYWNGYTVGVTFTISGIVSEDNSSGISFTLTSGTSAENKYYKYTTAIGTTSNATQTLINGNAFIACGNAIDDTQRTLTITTSDGNYSLSTVGAYKIVKRPVTVSFTESYDIRTADFIYTYSGYGQGVNSTPSYRYAALTFGYAFSGAATDSGTTAISVNGTAMYTKVNAGTYTLTVTSLSDTDHYALCTAVGTGSYTTGTPSKTFTINARNLATYTSFAAVSAETYNGSAITPTPTLSDSARGVDLSSSTEFTYSYSANVNAGTATITGTGKGNYTGTQTVTFTINPKDITGSTITTVATAAQTYTGAQITPMPTVTDTARNANLASGTDFNYGYGANVNVISDSTTEGSITVTGKNNYTGSYTVYFDISPKSVADSQVTIAAISAYTYNHEEFTPEPTVTFASSSALTLTKNTDFTYGYADNMSAGTGTVTVTGIGNYTGVKSTTFTINARAITLATADSVANQTYKGIQITPLTHLTDYSEDLVNGTDYTLSYTTANLNVTDTGSVTVTGKNNYVGSFTLNFTIVPKAITASDVVFAKVVAQVYAFAQIKPDITVTDSTRAATLTQSADSDGTGDFYCYYGTNLNAGTDNGSFVAYGINNYTGSTPYKFFDISRKPVTAYIEDDVSLVYDGTVQSVNLYASGYYEGDVMPMLTVTYNKSPLHAGTYIATAHLNEATYANYTLAKNATNVEFAIAAKPVKIVFSNFSFIYDGTVRAVAVALKSATSVCAGDSVNILLSYGDGVTVKNADDYVATATLSNADYQIENEATQAFTISPKAVSAAGKAYTKYFGNADPEYAIAIASGTPDGDITVHATRSSSGMEDEVVGTYYFSDIIASEVPNYAVTLTSDCSLKINKCAVTFKPTTATKIYGDDDPELSMEQSTTAFGIFLKISFVRESGENVGRYDYVNYTYTTSNATYAEYADCFTVNVSNSIYWENRFEITTRAATITIPLQGKSYGDADPATYGYTISENGIAPCDRDIPIEELFQMEVTRIAGENYEENGYPMYVQAGNANYALTVEGEKRFMIYKRVIGLTTPTLVTTEKVYDGTTSVAVTMGTTDLSASLITEARMTVSAKYDDKDVGSDKTVTVTYSLALGMEANFIAPEGYTLSAAIIPAKLFATIEDQIITYGDETLPDIIITVDGFVAGETASTAEGYVVPTVNWNGLSGASNAGNYKGAITLEGGSAQNYEVDVTDTAGLQILQAKIVIVSGDTYVRRTDGTNTVILEARHYGYEGAKFDDEEDFVLFYSARLQSSGAGSTFVIMSIQGINDTNYYVYNTVLYVNAMLQDAPIISVSSDVFDYDGQPKGLTVSASILGEPYTNIVVTYFASNYPESTELPVNAGEYTVKVYADEEDLKVSPIYASMIINKLTPIINMTGGTSFKYGAFEPYSATIEFLNTIETLEVTYDFTGVRPNAGNHSVTAAYAETENYTAVSQTATFTVRAIETTVKFSAYEALTYNGHEQYPVATIADAVEGDAQYATLTVAGNYDPINAGSYTVLATSPSDNYVFKGRTTLTYTIGKRVLVISVETGRTIEADTNPQLGLTYEGFADGDDASVLSSIPETIIIGGKVGENAVKLYGGSDSNYDYVLNDKDAKVEVVYESAKGSDNSNTLYIVLGIVGGVFLLVILLVIINKRKITTEYTNEHRR